MNNFSISDLEKFSGIKAHTIRIWEQRYNALNPKRTDGNTRFYDNSQLRRLLNIVCLINFNYKVSEICKMSDEEHFNLIDKQFFSLDAELPFYNVILQLISYSFNFDENQFEALFSNCISKYGFITTYKSIITPMLFKIGIMWTNNSISPEIEHFVTNLIKQKLNSEIQNLPIPQNSNDSWLLFLPENEFHEIALLFAHYLIRKKSIKSVYIGSNVPLESILNISQNHRFSHVLFFLFHPILDLELKEYIDVLVNNFKESKILISGNILDKVETFKQIQILDSVEGLENLLNK